MSKVASITERIDCAIKDSGIPDVNNTLIESGRVVDIDLEALMVNWDLRSLRIGLHGECQAYTFIN